MKNPFERKSGTGKCPKATHYKGYSNTERESKDHPVFVSPTLQYDWALDPQIIDECEAKKKSRTGVGSLVRKLNCGKMSSKERRKSMNTSMQLDGRLLYGIVTDPMDWRNPHIDEIWEAKSSPTCIPFSKEVNITVEGRNTAWSSVDANCPTRQNSSTHLGGPVRSAHFPLVDRRSGRSSMAQIMLMDERSLLKIGIDPTTVRKDRWLKLIQQGREGGKEHDYVTYGDNSTSYGSCRREGSTGSYSGDTEYTTESDDSDPFNCRRSLSRKQEAEYRSSRRKATGKSGRRVKEITDDDPWVGFAEDIGIFAGLILADGGACLSIMSDITHETVAASCSCDDTLER